MIRGSRLLTSVALILTLAILGGWLGACGGGTSEAIRYHCPMHPTYISDKPGDCPICNMRLVKMEEPAGRSGNMAGSGASEDTAAIQYHCPMHPTYVSDKPGDCPICGMKLVPIEPASESHAGHDSTAAAPSGYSVVKVGADAIHLAGIQTATAFIDTMSRTVRAVAIVKADETRMSQMNTRVSGWVEKLAVGFNGQFVQRGAPVLSLYSPELLGGQEEYLRALDAVRRFRTSSLPEVRQGADELLHSARARLLLSEVPEEMIRRIETTGRAERTVTLLAPAAGYLTGKEIFAGARVEPGMTLFTIADLSRVWLEADVYEYEAPLVRVDTEAIITLPYDPGFRRTARVAYVYPTLDPMTRTLRVRFDLSNPGLTLRPDMYANVEFLTGGEPGVVIPDDAVLDSGTRQIVFVQSAPGTFEPREVTLGTRGEGRALIRSGVTAGEQVVVRANFLLDSESRLRAAIGGFVGGHQHGAARSTTGEATRPVTGQSPATGAGAAHGGHQ